MKRNSGFTFVEFVILIIVFTGIAALFMYKCSTMSYVAKSATLTSTAASLTSYNAVNYASRKANHKYGAAIANCTDFSAFTSHSREYSIVSTPVAPGKQVQCVLKGPDLLTSNFTANGIK